MVGATVALIAAWAFANSLDGDFIQDDTAAVVNNPDVTSDNTTIAGVFGHDYWGEQARSHRSCKSYRPLTTLSLRWTRQAWGGPLDPRPFHVGNVALHALAAALFARFCARHVFSARRLALFRPSLPRSASAATRQRWRWHGHWDALAAGLAFAVHPVHADAVASIANRAELLAAVFYLGSLVCYVRAAAATAERRTRAWLAGAVACGACAMLSKEQGVTALAVAGAADALRLLSPAHPQRWRQSRGRRLGAVGAAAALLLALRAAATGGAAAPWAQSDNPAAFANDTATRVRSYA